MSSDQEILKQTLQLPGHPDVRLLDGSLRTVPAAQALLMVKRGNYGWIGSKKRIRKIQPLAAAVKWLPCYRTLDAAVLPPSIDWCLSLRS